MKSNLWIFIFCIAFVLMVFSCKDEDGDNADDGQQTDGDEAQNTTDDEDGDEVASEQEAARCPNGFDWDEEGGHCVLIEEEADGDEDTSEEEVELEAEEEITFPLEVGSLVPDFELPASDATTFKLSDYQGKKVLLSVFPAAKTAVCTVQTCWVSDNYDSFIALNTIPFGMSTDSLEVLTSWAEEESYNQLLLSDANPRGEVSEMFGIFAGLYAKRSNLIINENGRLVFKRTYRNGEQPDFQVILDFLNGEATK